MVLTFFAKDENVPFLLLIPHKFQDRSQIPASIRRYLEENNFARQKQAEERGKVKFAVVSS